MLTVADREKLLKRARAAKLERRTLDLTPIVPVARGERTPLSFAQQRLWFLEQLGSAGTAYHIGANLRLRGELDRDALRCALDRIVERHEALRTTFATVAGEPEQRIAPAEESAFLLVEHEASGEAELKRLVDEESTAPFDLEHGPLVRGRLIRLADGDHVLLVTMHHIVSDGWSTGVMKRELSALYDAFRRGEPDPLPALPVQYADYAAWQRKWVDGPVLQQQAEYWTRTLAGAPELLELPTDRPRAAVRDARGAVASLELDEALTAGLNALSQRHGTTLFMTLLAGWATVLGRLSGQDEVVIGTPSANRARAEIEGLIGFFVNTLALRIDLSGSPRVGELLERVKARALGAQQHQEIPFEQIVERVRPARSMAHSPLFQVMFAWQNAEQATLELPGLTLGTLDEAGHTTAKFDLTLGLREVDGRIVGGVEYATALFDGATIERHLGYLRSVLAAMVADEVTVDRAPMLSAAERKLVVEEWNATEAAYPTESCIHELFEQQAERTPDAVAVSFEGEALTYAELNARANQLAHHLRGMGVGPDVRVAICIERSLEMVVGLFAILKAGGAYVPLDPSYPADRLQYMLADSAPAAVLTQTSLRDVVAGATVPVIELDQDGASWASQPETNPAREGLGTDHLAYIIYTSGSTGMPKGVMNQHDGVVNRLLWMQDAYRMDASDAVLQKTPFSFDVSVWEFFWPLLSGARLVMARPEGHKDPAYLVETIRGEGITTLHFVPSMLQLFVEHADVAGCTGLKRVVCSGEALPAALVRRFHERVSGVELHNLYGPTEAAVDVTAWHCPANPELTLVPIGSPIANMRMYVLDAHGEPVPAGVAGELYIGGVGVARGYLNRPELTEERFVADPFSANPNARLYRTGDLGRWLSDGTIEYLGRNDFQVKIRGFRIELGEIEARLAEHADVRETAVLARESASGDKRLVAYYVADAELPIEALRAHLLATLPEHMVPAAYVWMERLPLSPNGKLDRKALPAPEGDAYLTRAYEAPRGAAETTLAEIWAELLGVERVGRNDHFFELGGHSLMAVTLIERMRRRGLHADVRTLFSTPTLAELAAQVRAESHEVQVPANGIPAGADAITPGMLPLVALSQAEIDRIVAAVPGGAANVQDIYPLAPVQEGMLFHHLMPGEGDPYLLTHLFRFDARERLDRFTEALQAVVARHDILRTSVLWDGLSEPVQVVRRRAELQVEEAQVEGDVAEELYARFHPRHFRIDVRQAPLLRGYAAYDAAEDRWLLLVLMHHLAGDHTTMEVLGAEVNAHLDGRAASLPEPLPFRRFVAQARLGVSRTEHEVFFRQMLGGVDEPTAPFGLLDVRGDGSAMVQARQAVDARVAGRLRERARRLGVSVASLCHVAFAQVLARATGREDAVFGTVLFGRMAGGEGADRVVGPFINTLPIRLEIGDTGAEAGVRQAHARLTELLRHEHASLALAQRCSGVQAPAPLFSALLNFRHGASAKGAAQAGIEAVRSEERTNYPLTLSVDDLGAGGLNLSAQVSASVGAERVCALMHTALEGLAEALESAPERPLRTLPVLPVAERRLVVEEWNATQAAYPTESCIHELFEAQAERTPDAVAVIHRDRTLTYAELNARANRLAHHLRALGVGPDARVGICMARGVEMVVGLLSVLKAGGAYAPLDPAYPADRLQYMLQDSAPVALLGDSDTAARFPESAVPVIDVCAPAGWAACLDANPARDGLRSDHLAYVIYTSGSTGMPKGVMLEHRNAVNFLCWGRDSFDRAVLERTLFSTSLNFDLAVFELFVPLVCGASVQVTRDALEMADTEVTLVNTVPSVMRALAGTGEVPGSVHTINLAGEPLKEALAEQIFATTGAERICNLYGPSETTTYSTWVEMKRGEPFAPHIGRPVANTQVYLLDAHGELVPAGVIGEIYIGGAGVARGYLNRPELTEERFLIDPFSGTDGARMYRTGDLGRWLSHGTIEYLGRNDFQVKIRGFRIELGEIEARLAKHADVREAAVLAREDVPGDKRLVAYYVAAAELPVEALRAHLQEKLPEHMVPAAYVWLRELPLTPNGKLDRKALPAPEGDAFGTHAYEAPAGETETALAAIWAELLGVERVGRHDDFFALGGHSLRAVQLLSRVRQELGAEVSLGDLFAHPVLAELARKLEGARRAELPAMQPADRGAALPLSFAQQRLWFLEQVSDLGAMYHIPAGLRLRGTLDRDALRCALDRIVERHEALRTTFATVAGEPVQRVTPAEESAFALAEHDLAGDADAEGAVRRLAREEAAARFDLEHGPLIRGRLVRMAEDDHVLLVTMHHIVSDAWSVGVMTRELSELYGAFVRGAASPLAPLPLQYADYAVWQRKWVDGEVLREQADYWTSTLSGAPELLELPTDRPRPALRDHRGAAIRLELDEALTAGLKALGQRHGTTLFHTLLAGWAAVLGRLSGQEEVVIGTASANRGRAEVEGLIGFFVNTLALRIDLSGGPRVGELLGRVKERALGAQQHQDIPFEQVVERVQPARSTAHTPLFQVMFSWQTAEQGARPLPGLTVSPMGGAAERVAAKFDLTLTLQEVGGRIVGGAEYATALFDRDTIERHLGYLRSVLEAMVAYERTVDRMPMLSPAERQRVLEDWNATDAEFPGEHCVHEHFERQAARTPHAVAVEHGEVALTYAELNARANRLAHHLRGLGVGPDARVAICVERGPEMVTGMLAVLKAGGAYVPMDPGYPEDRLQYMLQDSAPLAVLTQDHLRGLVAGAPALALDADAWMWAAHPESNPERGGLRADHLAYIIYTSGSTGLPKGVMVEHRNLDNLVTWHVEAFALAAGDRSSSVAGLGFDATTWEIWPPLCVGASLLLPPSTRDVETLLQWWAAQPLDVSFLPTPLAEFAVSRGLINPHLRTLLVGGDALRSLRPETLPFTLINNYGPTETTVVATSGALSSSTRVHIGGPVANTRIYILDAHGEPVPAGVAGEMYIGGAGVARGYLNRPELTEERFLANPFHGGRMYRTGDLARWLPDGNVEFLGRNDFQVKIRGFRIELGEIEARLAEHEQVREAAVLAREDESGDRRLVAYFVADAELEIEGLRAHLQAHLPEYMVPAAYVAMERMPLTPNGKLDRKALPAPEGAAFATRAYEAPLGRTERALAEIWAELLGVERVGRTDNFFELGGHSLMAVTLIERMRRDGLHADVRTLFSTPTLSDLAASVRAESHEVAVPPNLVAAGTDRITPGMLPLVELSQAEIDAVVAAVPGGAANVQDIYPLAPLQEGMLFHHLMAGEGDPYLLTHLFHFDARERLDAFADALRAVVARHDILRTAVLWEGLPEPVQVVWRQAPLAVEEVEVEGDVAEGLYERFHPRHFRMDVRTAPMLRGYAAFDAARDRWLLLVLMHHMAGDHTTLDVLRGEVGAHLAGQADTLPAPLPFRNFVAQARLGVPREEHEAFFREMLGRVDEPTAPFGLLDVQGDGSGMAEARLAVEPALGGRLRERARKLGVSVASLCHVAFAQVLARTSGRDDVVFGTVLFGRMQGGEGADRVVGPFINTLPVRLDVGEEAEAGVRQAHARLAELLRHEHASLALAQRCSGVQAPAPLFSALLNYRHSAAAQPARERGDAIETLRAEEWTNYPLSLSVDDWGADGFSLSAQVLSAVDAAQVCALMHTALEGLVDALESAPQLPLRALPVLPEAEIRRVVEEWNATEAVLPGDACIHALFEAQVERAPDAAAVVFGAEQLTYAQLNARANRLAHHLRALGVGPDARVAVCVERGVEMVVGLLAVLKAGGGYVPLDPGHPADRLRYVLEDSAPVAVLTQAHLRPLFTGMPVLALDEDAAWAAQPESNPERGELTASHLAYVIYTSGSTGLPKGVMIEHRSVCAQVAALQSAFGLTASDRTLQFASVTFDASVEEIFGALLSGVALVLRDDRWLEGAHTFWALCEEHGVTVADLPTRFWQLLLEEPGVAVPACVRLLVIGGEAVDAAALRAWFRREGYRPRLLNSYGPTETTVNATLHEVSADAATWGSIGRPVQNTRIYILDAHGQPVPAGVAGELYIGGSGVARGYLNRPELTEERFVADPFKGGRMYRTGDLGRWMREGTIEFLGRNDFQVKIRGFRIELGEIEARLAEHPEVRGAVVLAREDAPGEKRLVAYYVADAEAEGLRAHLQAQLPEYMVPAAYVWMERLPLTSSGKLDRKALPAPEGDAFATRAYEAPRGDTESTLAEIWAELLRVERVGRTDNFFELGGHSLLAVTLIERMRRAGLHADVRTLFGTPTLCELAAAVRAESHEVVVPANLVVAGTDRITPAMLPLVELSQAEIDRVVAAVPGGAANVQDIYPLAPLQEGMLFHHLMESEGDPYLLPHLLSFDARERLDAFLAALQAVVARHDILRTSVQWDGLPEPVQVVWRQATLAVEEVRVEGDVAEGLYERFHPRHFRIDVRQAPMLRGYVAFDAARDRWLLLVLEHHLAGDHTTMDVLRDEVHAHLDGREAELPRPLPFRNFVAQARLGVSRQEHEAFFSEMLGTVDEPTAPFGLLDVQGDGSAIAEAHRVVEPALGERLRERARKLRVSVASLCHVAYAQVLARTTGRDDVVFGTVLFGRMQGGDGADRVVGPFINTLPLRLEVGEEGTEASVRRAHARLAELLRHEHASLALAQRCSGVQAPAPLFSALLNYRHSAVAPGASPAAGGIQGLRVEERTNYPLVLSVDDLGAEFILRAQVHASVEAERVCALMHTALEGLADALESAPARPLRALPVLPEAEMRRVTGEWNATELEYPRTECVHELFQRQAERTPGAVAVSFGTQQLTYAQLNARANQLAHHLRTLGVGPDARVAICVERGLEMVVGLLAVLKAGGAYVPMDASYPEDRLQYMLADSAPAAVLTQARLLGLVAGAPVPVLALDEDAWAWAGQPETDPERGELTSAHLAYVIYTSGSTGTPKGVMVEHRNLGNLIAWHVDAFALKAGDRSSSVAGFGFDATTWEIWPPLCVGGSLLLPEATRDIETLLTWWAAQPLDVSFLPTPLAEFAASRGLINPHLRALLVGGDQLRSLRPEAVPFTLFNNYGPTETTVVATSGALASSTRVHIGGPVANTRVYILDAHGRPVPAGVAGEMYIGGASVARGYLNRPELTEERFLADPFHGGRMYRTGDLARWLGDGNIDFLGRNDFQVKIRGFRIELGEIEARLAEHAEVREVAVLAPEDAAGEKRLVAYYVAGAEVPAEALRAHLQAQLPEYMVPAAYVRMERMPLTSNGKLDRKALPAPEGDAFVTRAYEAPVGVVETALAEIWRDLLGVERVGRHDHFFELGGHSLRAVQLVSRVRQALGADVALGDLFARPVLAELAAALEGARRSELPPIEAVDRDQALPLSFAQQRLWFLEQLGDLGATYHMPAGLRLRGALDRDALRRALDRVVERHEALRTTFHTVAGEPVQRIAEPSAFVLAEHELGDGGEAELKRLAAEEASARFDLERGPLIRGRLVRVAQDDHVLLITMHHIVSDAWSVGVMTHELSVLYAAFLRGEADPLPALAVQYADYAAWQRKWVEGEVLREQAEYWTGTLAGAPELLEIPTDRPRPAVRDPRGAALRVELDEALSDGLKALSQRNGTTLFHTLLAGWATVLARLSGQEEVVIGTPSANRGRAEIEGLVGFFVNTLALRVSLGGAPTVAALLGRVRERALGAQQHQDIPFEQVVERVQPARSMAHSPLFQVMFSWQNAERGTLELPGLTLSAAGAGAAEQTAKFDLTLTLQEESGRITGSVSYATALFDAGTMERHLGHLRSVLEAMVAGDEQTVDRLPLLSPAERRRVVEEWNATGAEYPASCIHTMIEEQAERTPDAVAVVCGHQALTYAALNAGANRLAHHLRALGVGPDARVAICVEPGAEAVVGLLAILKSGGAYVPLDPNYPQDRLQYMLADSAPVVVLTQSGLRGVVDGAGVPVLELDRDASAWAARPESNPDPGALTPDHLAYIIYTSGSTGAPKGVMVPHRNAVQHLHWVGDTVMRGVQHLPWTTSLSFDASLKQVFGPLLRGDAVWALPAEVRRDPARILDVLQGRTGSVGLNCVPSFWTALLGAMETRGAPALCRLALGGEAIPQELVERTRALLPDLEIWNLYGPTETTVNAIAGKVVKGRSGIGHPIANTRVYILDALGEPVPVGVAGEIHVGGAGVARGYLDRPELTEERFVANPFHGGRMYRTGDLGRWLNDGTIEFLGRNDFQVKIRGFRIELGEIEARLAGHEAVREAVVLAREDAPGEKRLVAYYVADAAVQVETLKQHLQANLPDYMVPAAYVWLEALPLTPNGKLDRKALPAPEGDAFATRAYEAPMGETEEALAEVWAELLGVERVGRHDHFFELGGHSLMAVTLIERMRQRGLHADVRTLFSTPTLAELAGAVRGETHEVEVPVNLIPEMDETERDRDSDGDSEDEMEFIL